MLGFTETVLRDANQSLAATRMRMQDFIKILPEIDRAGFYSVECWGGATFDACLRYLNEDPWERLRILRREMPHTKLQMLLRGQNLLGYTHYPQKIVKDFVRTSIQNGIDIIRIFDALNDLENIRDALDATLEYGGHASCALCYTVSPVHNPALYVKQAKEMERMGAMSICIKDMSGCLMPGTAYELVRALKEELSVPVILHMHCTSGMAQMSCLKAIEAGVDVIDTAISSFSGGTSLSPTETMALVAAQCGREVQLDFDCLERINTHFRGVFEKLLKEHIIDHRTMGTNPQILTSQVPGGMYSNLLAQVQAQGVEDRLSDIVEEIPRIRKDLGYPPLVTPISQIVGTQAMANVITGVRYQTLLNETKAFVRGRYGKAPGEIDAELKARILSKDMPEETGAEDALAIREACLAENKSMEETLTQVLFPHLADKVQKNPAQAEEQPAKPDPVYEKIDFASIPDFDFEEPEEDALKVQAPLPGVVVAVRVRSHERIEKGQTLLVLESMKMENNVVAPAEGVIDNVYIHVGSSVAKGQELLKIDAAAMGA